MSIEIMVTLTLVDSESLADMRQQPRTCLPIPAAEALADGLRAQGIAISAHLAARLDAAIADARLITLSTPSA